MKKIILTIVLILFAGIIFALTVRGISGNPNSKQIQSPTWRESGPFELSPERGRFALLYSLVEDNSFIFSIDVARFATPDVAFTNGKYASLFAPLVSFAAMPGYLIGKLFGIAQVGAYATVGIFALLNMLLIRSIAMRLGAKNFATTVGSLVFIFASPAFSYAVTLYQHHISAFLILTTLYLILRFKNWLSLFGVWLLFATSIPVDYPNLVLMLPMALYATTRIVWLKREKAGITLKIKPMYIVTFISVLIPLLFYVWFSQNSYGKPLQLSGTLVSVQTIDAKGQPADEDLIVKKPISSTDKENIPEVKKTAIGFFNTRNILNGLYIHFISPDRGIIFFTPVMLFGILGAFWLRKTKQTALALITGVIGANVVLYSMWGDPWGGWAFGSRYLIPSYALASILIAIAITNFNKKLVLYVLFVLVAIYSIAVNTLGAITTNTNPPQVEVLGIEKLSHRQEKYTYERNWDYLNFQGSKSYAYNTYLKDYFTPAQYYWLLVTLISVGISSLLIFGFITKKKYD